MLGGVDPPPRLDEIARVWGRIGATGFGGPPAHIALLREACVDRHGWLDDEGFEQAVAATSLLPGPASTQLAIYCAWRVRGTRGALVGGACFIAPGLVAILLLSALFLAHSPPTWVRGAAAGAGAAVAAVAVRVGLGLGRPIWQRAAPRRRLRALAYAVAGAAATALLGSWLVVVPIACGGIELLVSRRAGASEGMTLPGDGRAAASAWSPLALVGGGTAGGLAWTAVKVGALSFGGGFVIVPMMQSDAVSVHHWMSHSQFLSAVALGQVTPGPVVLTVAAVGYAAGGIGGGLLAAAVAFAPSFAIVLAGGGRLRELLRVAGVRTFLAGAAPAAAGAIVGAAIPLAGALGVWWQGVVLAAAALALLALQASVVEVLVGAAAVGALGVLAGASLP
jgi:chromate transporter